MRSLPIQIGFNQAALQVVSVNEGKFFKQSDATASLSSNIDTATGKVFASIVRSGVDGAAGEGEVLVLTLRAIGANQQTEVKILAATPVALGDKTISPGMPAPFTINVTN